MNYLQYVKMFLAPAEKCRPLPRDIVLAQSWLESSGGKHAPGFNFFGIKIGKHWTGLKQYLWTHEMIDGVLKPIKDWFRKYLTPEESFADYKTFIISNPRYSSAVKNTDNEELYIELIAKAGYSSLPWFEYKRRVLNALKEIKIAIAAYIAVAAMTKTIKEVTSNG